MKGNFIFIILIEFEKYTGVLSLNAFHIGGKNEVYDVQQKYYVHIDGLDNWIEIKQKKCLSSQNFESMEWRIDAQKIDGYLQDGCVVVNFEFCTPVNDANQMSHGIKIPSTSLSGETPVSKGVRLIYVADEIKDELETSDGSVSFYITKFESGFIMRWCLSSCKKKLQLITSNEEIELEMEVECAKCSNFSLDYDCFVEKNGTFGKLFCPQCSESHHYKLTNILTDNGLGFFSTALKFSCIWNCGTITRKSINVNDSHELSCERSPRIKCPYANCNFVHVFDKLRKHLSFVHGELLSFKSVNISRQKGFTKYRIREYVWTHNNVLVGCVITNSGTSTKIEVQCVDKTVHLEHITMYFKSNTSNGNFVDEYFFSLNLLPIDLYPLH